MNMMRRYIAPFRKYLWGSVVLNILSAVFNIFSFAMIVPMLRILFRMTDKTYVFTPWNEVWHKPLKDIGNSVMQNLYHFLEVNIAQYGEIKVLFFLCLFLTPLASVVPACATAPALVYVGVLMLGNIKKIDMTDLTSSAVGFMTVISMLLTYSIANGIGIGAITYTVITIFTGKYSGKDIMVTIIALLFVLKFCMITM